MVLVYSHNTSVRLSYICSFIFKELMGVDFSVTTHITSFKEHNGPKINYSSKQITGDEIFVRAGNLLYEKGIKEQTIECFEINNYKAFYKTTDSDFPFDIFAASFYLLSRYEEYLPYKKDMYGRYAHENSLAYKENFLHLPLINIWLKDFAETIQKKYSIFNIQYPAFNFLPTYDIDIAYSYKGKGFIRSAGGFLRSPSLERLQVLLGTKKDPFDTYDWLDSLHERYQLYPIYFFLLAQKNGIYDKNILPNTDIMKALIKRLTNKYVFGIHPSWQSGDDAYSLQKEKHLLRELSESRITKSRQHYIRFHLPETYRKLIADDITDEYSMGYGSINGFRASVASSFYWYDLLHEEQTTLRIHPFCFMEANSFYEQKLSPEQAFDELMHYYKICKEANGTLITIFHNHMIGSDKLFEGWGKMYEQFLQQVAK
ncbi:polysaccharide deacetylase family protein [Ferruginibacter sp. SUN002]|uniref:polysaccharide deacetylase family protein n=1 Tax=Ferruginibacter sp. SUN002 TaxID=2937789 RepID=UPI003D3631C3